MPILNRKSFNSERNRLTVNSLFLECIAQKPTYGGFPSEFTSPLVLRIDYRMSILLEHFLLLQKTSLIIRGMVFKRIRLCEA